MSENKKQENPLAIGLKVVAGAALLGGATYLMYKGCEKLQESSAAHSHSPSKHFDDPEKCVVCWEKMEPIKRLNCGHVFHDCCASTWLNEKSTCPLCRKKQ